MSCAFDSADICAPLLYHDIAFLQSSSSERQYYEPHLGGLAINAVIQHDSTYLTPQFGLMCHALCSWTLTQS